MKKKLIIGITSAVILLGIGGFIFFNNPSSEAANLKTAVVEIGSILNSISTTGSVKSNSVKTYVGPQVKISSVNFSVGDEVKKGDILVEFDADDLSTTVRQAEIQYDNALISLETLKNSDMAIKKQIEEILVSIDIIDNKIAQIDLKSNPAMEFELNKLTNERNALLATKESLKPVTEQQYAQVNNTVELAKINLDNAKKAASKVQKNIVAEEDGVITYLAGDVGHTITYGQPIVIVQNLNDLKLVVNLSKYDSQFVEVGQRAIIKSQKGDIEGEVSFVSPVATVSTQNGTPYLIAEISFKNVDGGLIVDFKEDVEILIEESSNVIKVVYDAIKIDSDGSYKVFVINNGVVEERTVELGAESEKYVEITSGLTVGEEVIINPDDTVLDGTVISRK